jgi:hypothetical protein
MLVDRCEPQARERPRSQCRRLAISILAHLGASSPLPLASVSHSSPESESGDRKDAWSRFCDGRASPNLFSPPKRPKRRRGELREEGLRFDDRGRANPTHRLGADMLAAMIGEIVEMPPEEDREYGAVAALHRPLHIAPEGRLPENVARKLAVEKGTTPAALRAFIKVRTLRSLRTVPTASRRRRVVSSTSRAAT